MISEKDRHKYRCEYDVYYVSKNITHNYVIKPLKCLYLYYIEIAIKIAYNFVYIVYIDNYNIEL